LDIKAAIAIPEYFSKEEIDEIYGDLSAFEVVYDSHKALYEADFAFICSGTATLEAALIGTPFILSYIAKPLDYFIATKFVKIEYVGLSNIMFMKFNKREIHPEFLQDEVTVENLLNSYKEYNRDNFLDDSKALREYLVSGSSKNVAKIIKH
jgi:lipid-A-disaccharide synthase